MVGDQQQRLDQGKLSAWASGYGIGLTVFHRWPEFVDQVLFWSQDAKPVAAARAVRFIHEGLAAVEVTTEDLNLWTKLTIRSSRSFEAETAAPSD